MSWQFAQGAGAIGTGNWAAFPHERVDDALGAAAVWERALRGIANPWLCWCVDEDWCLLQQKLVAAAGWTPVVGVDRPRPRLRVIDSAILVDFNATLKLPLMWMHFPLEFAFAFTDRLAFWHSDVLPPVRVMRELAGEFDTIRPGELIGYPMGSVGLGWKLRRILQGKPPNYRRWYEVIGCTTREASRSQYEHGCGWWRHPECHPHAAPDIRRAPPHWEHGVGIHIWHTRFNGTARALTTPIDEFHYSAGSSSRKGRARAEGKQSEMRAAFDLSAIAARLGLDS